VAGKTGTAEKPIPGRGLFAYKYVASFVGAVPASNPRLVIGHCRRAENRDLGGSVAAPAFKQIALDCLRYLEIPPDRPS